MYNDVEHLFVWLSDIHISSLEKNLPRSFVHFLKIDFSQQFQVHKLSWWLRQKSVCPQCRRPRFNRVRKVSWRRKWQPTPVFLPGKSHGWRSLVGYSPWGRKELDKLSNFTFTFILGILAFHINFRINLLLSIKYLAEILTVIVLIDQFGENWYLGNLDFPYPWPQNSSPFVNFLEFILFIGVF